MSAIVGGSFKVASTVANQFDTELAATLVNPFPGYESLQTFGYNTLGDGGAGNYKHVLSTARQLTKFTSPDGRIWELMDRTIDLRQTGLKWDDPSFDNGPMLELLFAEAAAAGRKLTASVPGTLYVGNVDVTCDGHLMMDFIPGVWFHGMPGFPLGVIILRGTTPSGSRPWEVYAKNFCVDSSEREFAQTGGTGLALVNWNFVYTENFRAYAGTDPRGVGTPPVQHGDSGMTSTSVNSSLHVNMWCRGHPDLGLYITADPPLPPAPATPVHGGDSSFMDRGGHTIINPKFVDCTNGMKASRGSRRLRVIGGDFIRCSTGILQPDMSGTTPGGIGSDNYPYAYEMALIGLQMKRVNCGIRLGPLQRASIIGCQVEDWGYQPIDGTIDTGPTGSVRAAYALHGATNVHFAGCRGWFRDWDPVDEGPGDTSIFGFRLQAYTNDTDGTVYQSKDNVFTDCIMEGGNRAYQEEDLSDNNRGTIHCIGVGVTMGTHPILIRPGSSSQIRNGSQPINATEIHGNTNYTVVRDDAFNHRFTAALSTNRTIDFTDLDQQLKFQIFHISNESLPTSGVYYDIIVQNIGVGGVTGGGTSKTLKHNEWVDLLWDGTTLEISRAGFIYPNNIGRGQSGAIANPVADEFVVENEGDAGISILTPAANIGRLCFGDPALASRFVVSSDVAANLMRLGPSTSLSPNHLTITSVGSIFPSISSAQLLGDSTHHWLQTHTDELSVGGGANVKRVLTGLATFDFPSVAASGGLQNLTTTITGAVVNDIVTIGLPSNGSANGLVFKGWVSATNTVTVQAVNISAAPVDPTSATFRITVVGY